MNTRICYKCHTEKNLDSFYKNKTMPLGVSYDCKECRKKTNKRVYIGNKDRINEERRERYKNDDQYRKNRLDESNKWKESNLEKVKSIGKDYYKNNQDKLKERRNTYKSRRNKLLRDRYKNDLTYRVTCLLRHRLWETVTNNYKGSSVIDLLGCSLDYFIEYMSSLFSPGMSWDNHGDWHIDHILPCASFDLTKPEEQLKCFHYTNLQPLWREDNLSKSDKVQVLTSEVVMFI